jgi:YD repeat-containing protein
VLGYDGFGNVISQSVTGIGMTARVTGFAWSANGLYLATLTNALGQASSQTWNGAFGVPASVTDPNGLTTSWTYDVFGRRTHELRPDQTSTQWIYGACSSCGTRVRYSVATQAKSNTGAVIRTDESRFDAFDQEVVRLSPQVGGAVSQVHYDRDALGRITRTYVPYWVGGVSNGYVDTSFDLLNRPTGTASYTSTGALHASSSTSYSGLTSTTIDALGHATTRTALAWGGPARVTDAAGGNTQYQSNALGQLTQMTDAYGNLVLQADYNPRGVATSITNINRGTLVRMPNALGEIKTETDAKGQTRTYDYDLLGLTKAPRQQPAKSSRLRALPATGGTVAGPRPAGATPPVRPGPGVRARAVAGA